MKVLHIFSEINFSGAEVMYANAIPLFKEKEIELIVMSTGVNIGNYTSAYEKQQIRIIHYPIKGGLENPIKYLINNYRLYRLLKELHINVIHIHRGDLYMVAFCAWILNIRVVKTIHSIKTSKCPFYLYHWLERFIAIKISKVIFHTIGESVYLNELNYYHNPSLQINNWYDDKRFFPAIDNKEKEKLRENYSIPLNTFVVISVGGCSEHKRHSDILKAVSLVKEKLNILYIHLGQGATEQSEKQLAKELDIVDNVLFLGNKSNVRDFLVMSDVFIMTSKSEGLGNVALEAMACNIVCVLYNVPGLRDLIKNSNNGYLIEEDYIELAKTIVEVKSNTKSVSEKIYYAKQDVNQNYSLEKSVKRIIELYKE